MTMEEHRLRWAEAVVRRCLDELPGPLRKRAEAVPVVFAERPDAEAEEEADLLGLFTGDPVFDEGGTLDPGVTRISLFLGNLWDYAGGEPATFSEEVRITYLHELGHYFGWDEDDLAERGLD